MIINKYQKLWEMSFLYHPSTKQTKAKTLQSVQQGRRDSIHKASGVQLGKASGSRGSSVVAQRWGSPGVVGWPLHPGRKANGPWIASVLGVSFVGRVGVRWMPSVDGGNHAGTSRRGDFDVSLSLERTNIFH